MSNATKPAPLGFIDPALAGARELQRVREDVQAASGSLAPSETPGVVASIHPTKDQAVAAAQSLLRMLRTSAAGDVRVHLVVRGREKNADVVLPAAWSAELLQEIAVLLSGHAVQWGSAEPSTDHDDEVGTTELAKILGVSIPTATKVLDRGDIGSRLTPGGHRRVLRKDAEAWRVKRDGQRGSLAALIQMAKADEALGRPLPDGVQEDPEDES